jgi:hypothetical protein
MNKEDLINAQRELIKVLESQVMDLSMMSKIELLQKLTDYDF